MIKCVPLSAEMLNPCSNTELAATTANTPSDLRHFRDRPWIRLDRRPHLEAPLETWEFERRQ